MWRFPALTDGIARGDRRGAGHAVRDLLRTGDPAGRHRPVAARARPCSSPALVANLLDRGRMPQLTAQRRGPDRGGLPAAAARRHPAALRLRGPPGRADRRRPALARLDPRDLGTAAVVPGAARRAAVAGWRGPRTLHLDIVDYPGEWLLDLVACWTRPMTDWSEDTLARLDKRPEAADFMALARAEDGALRLDETRGAGAGRSLHRLPAAAARGRAGRIARRAGSCCRAIWPARPC